MARANTIQDGKLYIRCPDCGDSQKNLDHSHCVVNLDSGNRHCFRCGANGHLPLGELMTMIVDTQPENVAHDFKRLLTSSSSKGSNRLGTVLHTMEGQLGPLGRFSGVERRYQYAHEQGPVEIFEIRTISGSLSGFHARLSWKKSFVNVGPRLFGHGGHLNRTEPLRLVEGPYDVRESNDVCVFGIPTHMQAKALLWYQLILCPDSDVWVDYAKLKGWLFPFIKNSSWIKYVEYIADGDPDEVPPENRKIISWEQAKLMLKRLEYRR